MSQIEEIAPGIFIADYNNILSTDEYKKYNISAILLTDNMFLSVPYPIECFVVPFNNNNDRDKNISLCYKIIDKIMKDREKLEDELQNQLDHLYYDYNTTDLLIDLVVNDYKKLYPSILIYYQNLPNICRIISSYMYKYQGVIRESIYLENHS